MLNVGLIPFHRGRPEEAIPYFRKTIELDPSFAIGHAWLGMAQLWLKEYGEAETHIRKAVELSGSSSECIAYQGYFYGRTGKRNEALALARENEARYHSGRGSAYDVARIYAGLGEKEKTLKWLERDVLDRGNWIAMLGVDALFADIRKDPRVLELVKKIGIAK
jgi:tetratricopeptide (TPR) repeat protein